MPAHGCMFTFELMSRQGEDDPLRPLKKLKNTSPQRRKYAEKSILFLKAPPAPLKKKKSGGFRRCGESLLTLFFEDPLCAGFALSVQTSEGLLTPNL
jgi:hypothetical protein